MPFFHYSQNNSGGEFHYDALKGITHHVIIEADNDVAADDKAEEIGLYFDGVSAGCDCECCGDRWYRSHGDGDEHPSVYDEVIEDSWQPDYRWMDGFEAFVHYANGTIKGFGDGQSKW